MRDFYVYVDWTNESTPRPFYVGKGLISRIEYMPRNKWHSYVAKTFGFKREIVLQTSDERTALDYEIELIKSHDTFRPDWKMSEDDIRCNKTTGGDGVAGRVFSPEERQRLSERFKKWHKEQGFSEETRAKLREHARNRTAETRRKLSESLKGKKRSDETKQKLRDANLGKTHVTAPETRLKIRASLMGHEVSAETRAKISANVRRVPDDVVQKVKLLLSLGMKVSKIALECNISGSKIYRIKNEEQK